MESYYIIVFCLALNTIEGFENCNFYKNSIIVSYESDTRQFGCDKSSDFTLCEMFKEVRVWDQRCKYIKDHDYYKGECPRVKHVKTSERRCEYQLENIRQNGNDWVYFNSFLIFHNFN